MEKKPTKCIIDLGPGDGKKTMRPIYEAIRSNKYDKITVCLVDCSKDMLDTSEHNILRAMRLIYGKVPDNLDIKRFHEKFEDLKDDIFYKDFISGYDKREFLFYGTTAGNFDPPKIVDLLYNCMLSRDRVQVGIHLYTEGHDDEILKAYRGHAMEDVSFVGLEELWFTKDDRKKMKYGVDMIKKEFDEFKEFNLGPLTVIRTFFEAATEPMERGLIDLKKGGKLQALSSIKYKENQARNVFGHNGRFRILELYLENEFNNAIFYMEKNHC